MARLNINTIKKLEKERNTVHSEVATTYTVFEDHGNKYFQIDTYGKPGRDIPGKCSQSIQLDSESAKFFVDLLNEEFGL